MRRQVDHHLARARAVGRRATGQARTPVWPSLEAVERAVARMFEDRVTIDLAGDRGAVARVERQDLEEMAGNLIENAAKYGGDRVFVTVSREPGNSPGEPGFVDIIVEDEGPGIPETDRARIFERGARLDTGKPGTGLGLAIVRDVVQIYGGSVSLEESEDLGGLARQARACRPGSLKPDPAVDRDLRAGDIGRIRAQQEGDDAGDIGRRADAAERDAPFIGCASPRSASACRSRRDESS